MEVKGRILAIDYGLKRIGLALSDTLRIVATPIKTIENTPNAISEIMQIIQAEEVNLILCGIPFRNDDKNDEWIEKIKSFGNKLAKQSGLELVFVDEFMTSKKAVQIMVNNGKKKSKRSEKGAIDKVAAAIILQDYLESC